MKRLLKADHVSIEYKVGDFKNIGLKEWVMRHLTHNYHVEVFQAVHDVSFEVQKGDVLGIIGSNGAGKSTLLKAVSGIMVPTEGRITCSGSIAALLELGSGFDGDLTVKENTYLRGAILGYTRRFMNEKYREIIHFAELEKFEDYPFHQLSTGMQARLAFSIASMVQPDILILDEVMSVGDAGFQKKSKRKMQDLIKKGAATILVSHSLEDIREFSSHVLWMEHGRQMEFGTKVQEICDEYEFFLQENS